MLSPTNTPMQTGLIPLLGIDIWEHAYVLSGAMKPATARILTQKNPYTRYYLDYKNVRPDYLTAIWDVVNFDVVSKRLAAAKA